MDGQVRIRSVRRDRAIIHHHARVERDHSLLVGHHRIDVQFAQARQLASQFRDPDQCVDQTVQVDGGHAAEVPQHAGHPGAVDQIGGQDPVQRRQGERRIADHLDRGAPHAEGEHRTERRIARNADRQLAPVGPQDHFLDQHAGEACLRSTLFHAVPDQLEPERDLVGRFHRQQDTADLALVRDPVGAHLQHHREPDALGQFARLRGIRGQPTLRHLDAAGRQHRLGLVLAQHVAPRRAHGLDDPAGRTDVERLGARGRRIDRWGQLQAQFVVAHVLRQECECLHAVFRARQRRQARLFENHPAFGSVLLAQPGQHDRFARCVNRSEQRTRCIFGAGAQGRIKQHQHAVVVGIGCDDLKGACQPLRVGIATQVDRIGARPGRGQQGIERREPGLRQRGEHGALVGRGIGRQHAGSASVGENGKPRSPGHAPARQRLGSREQLVVLPDADGAAAPQCGVPYPVVAGHGSGMAQGRTGADCMAPGFQNDPRFDPRGSSDRRQERARVVYALDIQRNAAGFGVHRQKIEQLGKLDVASIADADDRRKSEAGGPRVIEQGGRYRAGLRHQGQAAASSRGPSEARIQADRRTQDAQAIGADQAHVVPARRAHHLILKVLAFGADLREPGRQDQHVRHCTGTRFGHQGRHGVRRRDHDGQIGRLRQRLQRGHTGLPLHRAVLRVDGVDPAREPSGQQVGEHVVAQPAALLGGSDHGHRAGRQRRPQVVCVFHAFA